MKLGVIFSPQKGGITKGIRLTNNQERFILKKSEKQNTLGGTSLSFPFSFSIFSTSKVLF
jgi:hypothetical protein